MARVEAGSGFESETSCSERTDRGHAARVEAIRGRYQNYLIHLSFVSNPVDGLEGQEELCFVNANGTWYKKEPNFQYNNYQQKPFYSNNQQGGYQARQNYSQGFSSKENQSTEGQAGSSTSVPQESSTDAMLKQILESQTRSEKHIGYEFKNLHTKVDGSYNDLNNKHDEAAGILFLHVKETISDCGEGRMKKEASIVSDIFKFQRFVSCVV
ncbi:hypothetical protein F2Q68_00007338 [Brassica cretica]|uniref:Uncharacterized protein n=1 Tax=Brassica cretica TaxID=69181 RepID=A0A8S9KQN3_BRACR|nr:hypothetical protein F2Q68_00007338 [Brassica cretica]